MENDECNSNTSPLHALEKTETASKKAGIFKAIRRWVGEPPTAIKAFYALAEVQSPTAQTPSHESVREPGIAGDIYRIADLDCGGPTR